MSHLIARILLAIFMLPLAALVYLIVFVWIEDKTRFSAHRELAAFLMSGATAWAFVALYWIALWRKTIQWTQSRMQGTALCAGGCIVAAAVAGIALASLDRGFAAFVASVAAPSLWLIGTTLLWRETAGERAQRVRSAGKKALICPTCGYNLTGLCEARCPECGAKFTLEELFALQPEMSASELEV